MEVSPMNKTAILSYIIDKVVLKLRNVSTNMRKRVHWMLKQMEITVLNHDERALIFNGLARISRKGRWLLEQKETQKGISNYVLKTQEQLDEVLALNNELRCCKLDFNPTIPIEVESIEYLDICRDSFKIFSESSFSTVKHLSLQQLSTAQIKQILTRFKTINSLEIIDCSIGNIDFKLLKVKQFKFENVSFKEQVYLPREIEKLEFKGCKSLNLVKSQRVSAIHFEDWTFDRKELKRLFKSLKGVKFARISSQLTECLTSLPSTVREINIHGQFYKIDNSEQILKRFPFLIQINKPFPIKASNKTQLRIIEPTLSNTQKKFSLRPRKIKVTSKNTRKLSNHPELFEKVESVYVATKKFNFDVLPSEIKRIEIYKDVDEESLALNRTEKERG